MKNKITSFSVGKAFALIMTGMFFLLACFEFELSSLSAYVILFFCIVHLSKPKLLISPLSIIHAYYFVFFVIAPAFSELHSHDNFSGLNFYVAYGMIFLTHTAVAFGATAGEGYALRRNAVIISQSQPPIISTASIPVIAVLYVLASSFVLTVVQTSGGLAFWMEDPGEAFLNRAGSGVYVVLSHLCTFFLAGLVGYRTFTMNSKTPLIIFIAWLALTSPVHGSKQLISIFLVLSLVPWIRSLKVASSAAIAFSFVLVSIFFFGLYLRNLSWITLEDAVPYALNYFTTLRNLILLIEDFDMGFMQTFFLPFNKFLTPFGLSNPSMYFDMNHMLTDKYFPSAWEIRATEQWPVEADLYLNFYFFFGLPVVYLYTFAIGFIYGHAQARPNLGIWVVTMLLTLSIVSHLRGSIYNHVDFYLYPMFFLIYITLRKYKLPTQLRK